MVREISDPSLGGGRRVEELEHTLESLREDAEISQILLGLSAALAEVNTIEETLEKAVRILPEIFGGDRCFAATCDESARRFVVRARYGYDEESYSALEAMARDEGLPLLNEALDMRQPFLVSDVRAGDLLDRATAERRGIGAYIGIPLVRWGEDFGGIGIEFATPQDFGTKAEALARGVARQVGVALANARRFNLLRDLRGVGLKIGSKLRLSAVVAEIAEGAAGLLGATGAAVYFLDSQHHNLVAAGGYGLSQDDYDRITRLDTDAAPWDALLGEGVLSVVGADALGVGGSLASAAASAIPGPAGGQIGAVAVFFDRHFALGKEEVEALQVLAAQASTAIENAQRFERQRRVARSLQEGLLATEMPVGSGYDFGAVYEPASGESEVGGDYFDVIDLPAGKFAVVVGDVSGKGAEAAAQTAMAKYMARAFSIRNPGPASVLFHLNNALVRGLGEDRFTTVVYAVFEPEVRRGQIALGGHPPPLIYRQAAGEVEPVMLDGGVLGVFEEQHFEQEAFELAEGDVFVAYTDGLIEARSEDGDMYGVERVVRSLETHAHLPPSELARNIYLDARAFGSITDDTVVVALSCKPAS